MPDKEDNMPHVYTEERVEEIIFTNDKVSAPCYTGKIIEQYCLGDFGSVQQHTRL